MGYFQTPWHIILLLVIALLLFGGKRLPEVGRALGSGMREFKDAITGNTPGVDDEPTQSQPELRRGFGRRDDRGADRARDRLAEP